MLFMPTNVQRSITVHDLKIDVLKIRHIHITRISRLYTKTKTKKKFTPSDVYVLKTKILLIFHFNC